MFWYEMQDKYFGVAFLRLRVIHYLYYTLDSIIKLIIFNHKVTGSTLVWL